MVSGIEPDPALQPPNAEFVFADWIASRNEQPLPDPLVSNSSWSVVTWIRFPCGADKTVGGAASDNKPHIMSMNEVFLKSIPVCIN